MEPVDVLVVCTANIARSPLAERLLQAHADHRLGPGAVVVHSAGVHARTGDLPADGSVQVADQWGLDLRDHRSRPVTPELAARADLVLTMSRRHRDKVTRLAPGLLERTYTLRELVRLLPDLPGGGEPGLVREHLEAVLHRAHETRPLQADGRRDDDVVDPWGGPYEGYVDLGNTLVDLTEPLVDVLFGPAR